MDNPFFALKKNLETVFRLAPIRNGAFAYSEIQQLKEALERYHPQDKRTFVELVKALRATLHHFDKWRINFDAIKNPVDALAQYHQMPTVNWDKFLSHPKPSARFQYRAEQDIELIPWITATSKKNFEQLKYQEQINLLVTHSHNLGFSQKISAHLKKDPEFLSRFIMESKENFTKISSSRLIFYLTDEQIAQAIIKYLPSLTQEHPNPYIQIEQLVEKLNAKILSNGRSISTLLRNSEAKSILESSELFQIYQSDEYQSRESQSSLASEQENMKPNI